MCANVQCMMLTRYSVPGISDAAPDLHLLSGFAALRAAQHADKVQSRHDLGGEGTAADLRSVPEFPVKQRKSEGQGWAPMDKVTQANTFTGSTGRVTAQALGS